jgi:hypothetical protein
LLTFLFALALTLTDLQGNWMNAPYADALVKTRSPLQAERLGTPLSMTIRGDRAEITTYHEASWRRILSVGKGSVVVSPLEDPNGKAETLPLAGNRNRIYVELWPHTRVTYRRLDVDPESYARRVILAGTYTDARGVKYVFGETGELTIGSAAAVKYHVSLDTSEACCDYFVIGEENRVGFRWKNKKLQLYKVIEDPKNCPISCAKTPYAVLTPVR